MAKEDVYYNETDSPVFIVMKWSPDPEGGAAKWDQHISVAPGDGIDISILGFKRRKANAPTITGPTHTS
jgi:hypothetical protein